MGPLEWNLTVQGPLPALSPSAMIVTFGGQDWRPVQTCSLEDHPSELTSRGYSSEAGSPHPTENLFYRSQMKFAKLMFLQLSVCPQGGMHGRGACVVGVGVWVCKAGRTCMVGGAWGHAWQRGACVAGMCVAEGACVAWGMREWWGACMAGGHAWQGGMHGRGACMAGGMHCGEGACIAEGVCMVGHVWQGCMHGEGVCVAGVLCGRGHAWQGGMHSGGCAWQGACMAGGTCPPPPADTTRYGQ